MTRYLRALTLPLNEHLLFSRKAGILAVLLPEQETNPNHKKEILSPNYWFDHRVLTFTFIDVEGLSLVYIMTWSSSAQSQGH